MYKLRIVLVLSSFIFGGIVGGVVIGYIYHIDENQALAEVALYSVADDIRIITALQSEGISRTEAIKEIEQSTAGSLLMAREAHPSVKNLDYMAGQGLCAAYVYINQGGYSFLGSPPLRKVLKDYLDQHGPDAIRRLEKIRSDLGQQPFKPEYAQRLGLKVKSNPMHKSATEFPSPTNFTLEDCYKGPTEGPAE